jgi:integrase
MRLFERDGMTHVEWYAEDGKRKRASLGVPWGSPAPVIAEKTAALIGAGGPKPKAARGPSLQVVYNKALASHYAKQKDVKGVQGKWKLDIAPFFGADTAIQEVARADRIAEFKAHLFDRGNHPKTVNRKLMVVSKLLKLAVEWGYLDRCPKMPLEDEDEGRVRWLSDAEERDGMLFLRAGAGGGGRGNKPNGTDPAAPRLLAAEFADLCEFLIDSGVRFNEARNAEDRMFDFTVTPTLLRLPGWLTKSGKARTVGLTEKAARHVYVRLRREPDRQARLPGSSRPWHEFTHDRAGDLWTLMRAHLGLHNDEDFVIHALRHTFAVRMLEGGVDIRVVQYLMGHVKADTTAIYAHVSPRLTRGAVDALEARAKDVPEVVPLLRVVNER